MTASQLNHILRKNDETAHGTAYYCKVRIITFGSNNGRIQVNEGFS